MEPCRVPREDAWCYLPVKTAVRMILFDKKHPLIAPHSMVRLTEHIFDNHYILGMKKISQ
jgi:hypothetical protein